MVALEEHDTNGKTTEQNKRMASFEKLGKIFRGKVNDVAKYKRKQALELEETNKIYSKSFHSFCEFSGTLYT